MKYSNLQILKSNDHKRLCRNVIMFSTYVYCFHLNNLIAKNRYDIVIIVRINHLID